MLHYVGDSKTSVDRKSPKRRVLRLERVEHSMDILDFTCMKMDLPSLALRSPYRALHLPHFKAKFAPLNYKTGEGGLSMSMCVCQSHTLPGRLIIHVSPQSVDKPILQKEMDVVFRIVSRSQCDRCHLSLLFLKYRVISPGCIKLS